jgi:hypothetical protein
MPTYLDHKPHVVEDTSFVAVDVSFFDAFNAHVSCAQNLCPSFAADHLPSDYDDIFDDNLFNYVPYVDDLCSPIRELRLVVLPSSDHHPTLAFQAPTMLRMIAQASFLT